MHQQYKTKASFSFQELKQGIKDFGIDMTEDELKALFDAFDRDSNGSVDFNEFMCALRPSMSPARVSVIDEAFDKLDVNGDGVLRMDDLKSKNISKLLVFTF